MPLGRWLRYLAAPIDQAAKDAGASGNVWAMRCLQDHTDPVKWANIKGGLKAIQDAAESLMQKSGGKPAVEVHQIQQALDHVIYHVVGADPHHPIRAMPLCDPPPF